MKLSVKFITALLNTSAVIFLLTACQKEITGDVTSPVSSTYKVKTYSEYNDSVSHSSLIDSFNLTFDSQNRITSLISGLNGGDKFLYAYNSDNTYTLDIYTANTLSIHALFFINGISLVDSSVQSDGVTDTTTEKYLYNSNKELATKKEYFYSQGTVDINTFNYTYDNAGNVTQETSDNGSTITAYEYYPDQLLNLNMGQVYFYQNKNLIKTTTITSGGVTNILQHTYTFDSSNRQTSERIESDNGEIVIRRYTYF